MNQLNNLKTLKEVIAYDIRANNWLSAVKDVEDWLFSTPEGKEYLENKGWVSAEDIKQSKIAATFSEFGDRGW